ncbi:hypothetical protein EUTSA_v10002839mg [Eutrema salsugineum]|uniref:C2H2-type domain-containing protein n=1 Tax=Eutrema salsugineum TaxID=72664 RepID=V4KHT3_EUTSA|nr:zinc finger protein ZAT8 [Eutrema salsugineum]ESQ37405.1 hypothetical protein EUTSA_v10002839mg [Eutrema salsugineum]
MVARSEDLARTAQNTPANSDNLDRKVQDTAANCLMLLSKVGDGGGGDKEKRVFRCKTCMKEFSSFQALGGHRASHGKPINTSSEEQSSSSSSLSSGSITKKAKKTTSHTCPICGVEFPMGQALGGHMRKHRNEKEGGALVTRSFLPEETSTVTTLKKSSSGKRVACFDLGFDSMGSIINLKLELGRTIS